MLGGKENTETLQVMMAEVRAANYTTAAVADVIQAHTAGLVSDETASVSLGYEEDEVPQARKDRAERATLTLLAQTAVNGQSGLTQVGAGARGVPEIDPNEQSAKEEKEDDDG